jgi:hypothetical protein
MTPPTTNVLDEATQTYKCLAMDPTLSVTFDMSVPPAAVNASATSARPLAETLLASTCGPTHFTADNPRPPADPPLDDYISRDLGLLLERLPPEDWDSFAARFIEDKIYGIGSAPLVLTQHPLTVTRLFMPSPRCQSLTTLLAPICGIPCTSRQSTFTRPSLLSSRFGNGSKYPGQTHVTADSL